MLPVKVVSGQINEEQKRLVKSILTKVPQSNYSKISINKLIAVIIGFFGILIIT